MDKIQVISSDMAAIGLNYSFMEYVPEDEPVYPYWVGEYQEEESLNEDGEQDSTFIVTGFSRTTWEALEEEKEKIRKYYGLTGKTVITDTGSAVAVFYMNAFPVPTGDAELKKIQINLRIKEWTVNN